MIVAVTNNKVYLLDWNGTHLRRFNGSTKILFEFSRSKANIKSCTRSFTNHTVEIKEDRKHVKIECNLGPTHLNKTMNREVIDLLKQN